MQDPRDLAEAVRVAALTAPGATDAKFRRALYDRVTLQPPPVGSPQLGPEVEAFVSAVDSCSEDTDLAALSKSGKTDDEIFEIAVVVAVGAGLLRMDEGLRAAREP